jgi:hypothetical protein
VAGRKQERAKRPHIYGDQTKARRAVARYITDGDDLLGKAVGLRKRVEAAKAKQVERLKVEKPLPPSDPSPFGLVWNTLLLTPDEVGGRVAGDWLTDLDRWRDGARRAMQGYLQDQFSDLLPTLDRPIPRQGGERRSHISLDNGEPWLHMAVDELKKMQAALGVQRAIPPSAPSSDRFAELRGSGLIEAKVVSDNAKAMAAPRTAKQLNDAIGAAKELTEATLRGALDQLGESPKTTDDLQELGKKLRRALTNAAPDPAGAKVLDSVLANLVRFLAEWRNLYGRGHGRTKYPPGVKARHARLATDAAETCIRCIVTTMDDLELLAPA